MNSSSAETLTVGGALKSSPIMGVVRTACADQALRWAETAIEGGLEMIEVTFSVPEATQLVARLLAERSTVGPPCIGMGTVTTADRARQAVDVGAEFIVSPNVSSAVAKVAKDAGKFLVMGALTPTEIVNAYELGADIVKVYPLPPVGGPDYLAVARQPLSDIPMLAAGGFGVDEIASYKAAGASAFGLAVPAFGDNREQRVAQMHRGLAIARGEG